MEGCTSPDYGQAEDRLENLETEGKLSYNDTEANSEEERQTELDKQVLGQEVESYPYP